MAGGQPSALRKGGGTAGPLGFGYTLDSVFSLVANRERPWERCACQCGCCETNGDTGLQDVSDAVYHSCLLCTESILAFSRVDVICGIIHSKRFSTLLSELTKTIPSSHRQNYVRATGWH